MSLRTTVSADGLRVVDLGRPLDDRMPHSPTHPGFAMTVRPHGPQDRPDGLTGSHETMTFGGHTGTHVDAPAHVAVDGLLHGGVAVADSFVDGRHTVGAIDQMAPFVGRAVLYDLPRLLGRPMAPAEPVTLDHLRALEPLRAAPGDAVLFRTGWGARWPDPAYADVAAGQPGIDLAVARHLGTVGVRLVGADTLAVEQVRPEHGLCDLPVHRHLLWQCGIHLVENLDLDALAATGATTLHLVCAPLAVVGATGAPVRPLALIDPVEDCAP